jgi:hypothetical protein
MTVQIAGTTARIEDSAVQIRDISTGIEERTVRVQVSVSVRFCALNTLKLICF